MRIIDGQCVAAHFFEGPGAKRVYLAFVIILFIGFWAVPVPCFLFLYGMVAITMQKRKRDSKFETNRLVYDYSCRWYFEESNSKI